MEQINMHAAKSQLSRLVQRAASGETILIAKAGRPVAKLVAVDADADAQSSRFGFLADRVRVPDDFDELAAGEVAAAFLGD